MATTSSNLMAGKAAIGGQGGNGKGSKGRVAGLVATAALGLSLLGGLAFSQMRHEAQSVAAPASGNPAVALAAPNQDWALADGTRPGLLELMPGETPLAPRPVDASTSAEFRWASPNPASTLVPAGASTSAEYRWGFGGTGAVRPAEASTTTEYRWDFAHPSGMAQPLVP